MSSSDSRDEAEFLVRSENRVRVLQRLVTGPADRATLQEAADTSRVTLGRILSDFEDRNWVRRHSSEYRITTLGETVCEGLGVFLDSVAATQRLRDVIEYLPVEELDVPLRHLHDATVIRPTESLPSNHVHSLFRIANDAEEIRGLWSVVDMELFRLNRDWAVDGDASVEFVFGHDILETYRSEFPGRYLAELTRSPDGAVYEHDEASPGTVLLIDDIVLLLLIGENGYEGAIESADPTIRAWAADLIERYRDRSTEVDPASFAND